jgi:ubiquinone/menaquinone biosynthesis C-methylase UbiE
VIDTVSQWYENPEHIDEMKGCDQGKLKIWEQNMCGKFPKGCKILDIGCGVGREAFSLSKFGFQVVGIDISNEAVGRERIEASIGSRNVQFEVYNGETIPFENESFDVVIIWSQTFGLLYGDEYKSKLLQECKRVLKSKGLLNFSGHSYQYLSDNYSAYLVGRKFYPYRDSELYWETFYVEDLELFAKAEGFAILEGGEGEIYKKEDGIILYCLCEKAVE